MHILLYHVRFIHDVQTRVAGGWQEFAPKFWVLGVGQPEVRTCTGKLSFSVVDSPATRQNKSVTQSSS